MRNALCERLVVSRMDPTTFGSEGGTGGSDSIEE